MIRPEPISSGRKRGPTSFVQLVGYGALPMPLRRWRSRADDENGREPRSAQIRHPRRLCDCKPAVPGLQYREGIPALQLAATPVGIRPDAAGGSE